MFIFYLYHTLHTSQCSESINSKRCHLGGFGLYCWSQGLWAYNVGLQEQEQGCSPQTWKWRQERRRKAGATTFSGHALNDLRSPLQSPYQEKVELRL